MAFSVLSWMEFDSPCGNILLYVKKYSVFVLEKKTYKEVSSTMRFCSHENCRGKNKSIVHISKLLAFILKALPCVMTIKSPWQDAIV